MTSGIILTCVWEATDLAFRNLLFVESKSNLLVSKIFFSFWKQIPGILHLFHRSRIVRKPDFCLGESKGADQLRGNREADQRLCFRYSDSTIPLLLKSEISSF